MVDEVRNMTDDELQWYYNRLKRHDWYYDYSDDHRVWTEGNREESLLMSMSRTDKRAEALFEGFRQKYRYNKDIPEPELLLDNSE